MKQSKAAAIEETSATWRAKGNDLTGRIDAERLRLGTLANQRSDFARGAADGDHTAQVKLDSFTAEQASINQRITDLEAALSTARERLAEKLQAEAQAEADVKTAKARAIAD